jgi:hypothetical protein
MKNKDEYEQKTTFTAIWDQNATEEVRKPEGMKITN